MARRKDEEQEETPVDQETDVVKLSKALVKAFNKDEAKTGKIAWNLATDGDNPTDVKEWISTGNVLLDYSISNRKNGGVPVGKLTEIVGEEASGKSLMCAELVAECQRMGGVAAYLDAENAMNPDFAQQIGVNLAKMIYLQPGTVEEAGEMIEKMIVMTRQKAPNQLVLIVWDSTAQTPTSAEIEGDFDINMNVQMEKPKQMGKMMRKLTQTLGKERICLVFTNQLKFKPGVSYGDPMYAPGGKAVPYAASVRIKLERGKTAKEGAEINDLEKDEAGDGDVMGVHTRAKIIKNRCGPPLRKCQFFISFAHGIENEQSWFQYLRDEKIIAKDNGWCVIEEFQPVLAKHYEEEAAKETDGKRVKELKALAAKAVPDGKGSKGWQFRAGDWPQVIDKTPRLRAWLEDKLDKLLVVKYGEKAKNAEVDPESLMEVEQLMEELIDPK
jgi:recombination protein RecA